MIRIITLYNSYNVGAFLQAFSLYSLLKKKNWDVSFLDVGQNPEEYFWRSIKYVRNPVDIIFQLRQRRKYRRAVKKHLPIVKKNQLGQGDTIIVGSDEMWNVNNGSFVHLQEYFGRNLVCRKKITYAVSGNGTGIDDLRQFDKTINFSEFDALSVRDNSTAMLVSSVAKRTAKKVCDPTVLFRNFQSEPVKKLGYDFLLVYAYPANLTADECWQLNLERPTERPPHRDEILQECLTYGTYQTIVKYYGEKRQNLLMRIVRKIKKLVVWRQ